MEDWAGPLAGGDVLLPAEDEAAMAGLAARLMELGAAEETVLVIRK